MRDIIKNIQLPIDGKQLDFRLTKLDAFSGAALLQILSGLPPLRHSERSEESPSDTFTAALFASISPENLRTVMISCLNHVEVLLPAGYQPVMQGPSWSWPELEHDTATCLKLTLEEALWTLRDFFSEGGPTSRPAESASSRQPART